MKNTKNSAYLYFIASILFYISGIFNFLSDSDFGIVYICLGSTFLCLGVAQQKKDKDDNK